MRRKAGKIKTFRDLGGIVSENGKSVVYGKLMRSGHHGSLKKSQELWLSRRYDVRGIIDLRADMEVADKPDVIIDNVRYFHIPLLTDEQNPVINRATRLSMLKKIIKNGGAKEHLCEVYRIMVSSEMSRGGIKEIFGKIIGGQEGGILWHCTQGKDRTGMATASILMALGCDRETIIEDYMRYNKLCRVKNFFIYLGVMIFTFSIKKASTLNRLLTARREYIQSAFDEIDRLFGGEEGFLKKGIGLTDEEICRMREIYLE